MKTLKRILVTDAGSLIGHHLFRRLKSEGNWVRTADLTLPEYETNAADGFAQMDLRKFENCLLVTRDAIESQCSHD